MRYVVVILGLVLLVGGLAALKFAQISSLMAFGKQAEAAGPPPEAVATAHAERTSWEGALAAVGSVASSRGVSLSSESPGVVTKIDFESGNDVKRGQVVVELDTSVERAQLAQSEARRDYAKTTLDRTRSLVATEALSQAQLDQDQSGFDAAQKEVEAIKAQIERKTIRAPFAGKLGIRAVNLGQYLSPGTPVTMLEAIDAVYVDFTLPQQRLSELHVGMPVRCVVEGTSDAPHEGTLAAIEPAVDAATRSIRLRATVPNKDEKLRPGMFVNVSVVLPNRENLIIVPATAIVHAPYGDSVFVVEDKKPGTPGMMQSPSGQSVKIARQQFVRTGEARGDFVAVSEGVAAGQEVVTAGAFKLRNGAPIVVNNVPDAGAPPPQLNPRPENR